MKMDMNMKITILGASSGFGREFTRLLAVQDNEITAISNDKQGLNELKEYIFANYRRGIEVVCRDLTNADDLDYVCARHTDCDFLINSAGGGKIGNITSLSIEEEQYYMNLNMWAFHKVTKTALLKMIYKRRGNVLNVCSAASFAPMPNFSIYAATKAFAGSYTLALAREAEPYGVRVMALCPGPTRTNFLTKEHYDAIQKKFGRLPVFMTPEVTAKRALKQFNKGKILYLSGALNKAIYWLDKFSPRTLINNVIYKMYDDFKDLG